jgi:hypothetical protein
VSRCGRRAPDLKLAVGLHLGYSISRITFSIISDSWLLYLPERFQGEVAMQLLQNLAINTVYLMGGSFILGSLFTLFMLILLDFARKAREMDNRK